jgi:hypothetical protein
MCQKHMGKLATYRIDKSTDKTYDNITNTTHAQIDYILVERRWRDTTTDAESHARANIRTDHYPPAFKTRIKRTQIKKGCKSRPMYRPCDSTQQADISHELQHTKQTILPESDDPYLTIKNG